MSDRDFREACRAWAASPDDPCAIARAVRLHERNSLELPEALSAGHFTPAWLRGQAAELVRRCAPNPDTRAQGLARVALAARVEGAVDQADRLLAEAPVPLSLDARLLTALAASTGEADDRVARAIARILRRAVPSERVKAACKVVNWISAAGWQGGHSRRVVHAAVAGLSDHAVWRALYEAGSALPRLGQAHRFVALVARLGQVSPPPDALMVEAVLEWAGLGPGVFDQARPYLAHHAAQELPQWDSLLVPTVRALSAHDPDEAERWEATAQALPPAAAAAALLGAALGRRDRGELELTHMRVAVAGAEAVPCEDGVGLLGSSLGLLARLPDGAGLDEARAVIGRRAAAPMEDDARVAWHGEVVRVLADVPGLEPELQACVDDLLRRSEERRPSELVLLALANVVRARAADVGQLRAIAGVAQAACRRQRTSFAGLQALGRCVAQARVLLLPERHDWAVEYRCRLTTARRVDVSALVAQAGDDAWGLPAARRRSWLGEVAGAVALRANRRRRLEDGELLSALETLLGRDVHEPWPGEPSAPGGSTTSARSGPVVLHAGAIA